MLRRRSGLVVVALSGFATAMPALADPLPLDRGQYVAAGSPCHDAPLAAMMTYDGRGFGDAHDTRYVSTVSGRSGQAYEVSTTCSAAGDGSPVAPTTVATSIAVLSRRAYAVGEGPGGTRYRWCAALPAR